MSSIEKNYTIKILILFIATFVGIFAIWYAMVREESVDWISSQVAHQVSPYAITETDSSIIIGNVVMGYEFSLPKDFKTVGSRNLTLFIEEAGQKKCEIKHSVIGADKAKQLIVDNNRAVISLRESKLIFELVNQEEKNNCEKYLLGIRNNLMFN